ncbi:hypothetical protein Gorai_021297 [Gossypium raimondii]|uniref:Uncharacterized protein n=1 Tax=Gossypium raimondii TaxID=29730 RepID=A0A7J8NQA6_GOSRA|nr:hypothetical protein [Gossypium raimondii]
MMIYTQSYGSYAQARWWRFLGITRECFTSLRVTLCS